MDKDYLTLKRPSAFRPSGEWNDDDYDVLAGWCRRRPDHEGAMHRLARFSAIRKRQIASAWHARR
jgi:hypothetical protein